jgi:hypothetical protein
MFRLSVTILCLVGFDHVAAGGRYTAGAVDLARAIWRGFGFT